jgi:hypothetical protein
MVSWLGVRHALLVNGLLAVAVHGWVGHLWRQAPSGAPISARAA